MLPVSELLEIASEYLGKEGYKDLGNGRFLSESGHQVRMSADDLLGTHGGGPHINFDLLGPNPKEPGTLTQILSIHIYFFEDLMK